MRRLLLGGLCASVLAGVVLLATDGPLTPLMNLRTRTNENGYLIVSSATAGATDGPLTPMANLRGRTDENGYLRVSLGSGASIPNTSGYCFTSRGCFKASADGVFNFFDNAGTSFGRLTLGGTTASFPSLKRNSSNVDFRLADDTAYAGVVAGSIQSTSLFNGQTYGLGTTVFAHVTAPTIASGGCTSPAVTWANGTAAFLITIGSSCSGVKTFTLTMPASSHFWACTAVNNTSDAAQITNLALARATSTTAVVVTSYDHVLGTQEDFTAADTYLMSCLGG